MSHAWSAWLLPIQLKTSILVFHDNHYNTRMQHQFPMAVLLGLLQLKVEPSPWIHTWTHSIWRRWECSSTRSGTEHPICHRNEPSSWLQCALFMEISEVRSFHTPCHSCITMMQLYNIAPIPPLQQSMIKLQLDSIATLKKPWAPDENFFFQMFNFPKVNTEVLCCLITAFLEYKTIGLSKTSSDHLLHALVPSWQVLSSKKLPISGNPQPVCTDYPRE